MDMNKYGTLRKKINKDIPFNSIEQRDYEVCNYLVDQQYLLNKRADQCKFIRYDLAYVPGSKEVNSKYALKWT